MKNSEEKVAVVTDAFFFFLTIIIFIIIIIIITIIIIIIILRYVRPQKSFNNRFPVPQTSSIFFRSLPNDKFLKKTKFKPFADDKINVTQNMKFWLERIRNIVVKGENASYQYFILFPQCFIHTSFPARFVNTCNCVVKGVYLNISCSRLFSKSTWADLYPGAKNQIFQR